jgi:tRNA pseudouridine38/39 synthase
MYKYFFPCGNLNLDSMRSAAQQLIGEHDFRNLCKMDVANGVVSYRRRIIAASLEIYAKDLSSYSCDTSVYNQNGECLKILECDRTAVEYLGCPPKNVKRAVCGQCTNCLSSKAPSENDISRGKISGSGFDMCELTIVGQAFLWHQIRCIVAILFLIGQGRERADIIAELLDIDRNPRKPQYTMAAEFPLVLFDCVYDNDSDIRWQHDAESDADVVRTLQSMWTQHSVRATMIRRMLDELGLTSGGDQHQATCLAPGSKAKVYKPLFERELCESLEDRIEHYAKRRKRNS